MSFCCLLQPKLSTAQGFGKSWTFDNRRPLCFHPAMTPTDPWKEAVSDLVRHLEERREDGERYVRVDENLLGGLSRSGPPPAAAAPAPQTAVSPEKAGAYARLEAEIRACTLCAHLASFRTQVVPGVGNLNAAIMFVGEAPGADEDKQGEPFVGRAGQLLTKIIQTMGLRRQDVFIGNVLKCRPDVDTPAGNRKPTPEEMRTCLPYLKRQIELIGPRVLVALGDTAVKGLVPELKVGITRLRGQWLQYEGIPLMPTYHPAYLLRNQSLALKRQCWEDMLAVLERAGLTVTEKQRGYFLNSMAG